MTIRFSDESRAYLPEERLEVARAMIHAGIESASQMEFVERGAGQEGEQEGKKVASGSNSVDNEVASLNDNESALPDLPEGIVADDLADDRILH